jgi:hypothetical protein
MNEKIKALLVQHGITDEVMFDSEVTEQQLLMALSAPAISRVSIGGNSLQIEYHIDNSPAVILHFGVEE